MAGNDEGSSAVFEAFKTYENGGGSPLPSTNASLGITVAFGSALSSDSLLAISAFECGF